MDITTISNLPGTLELRGGTTWTARASLLAHVSHHKRPIANGDTETHI